MRLSPRYRLINNVYQISDLQEQAQAAADRFADEPGSFPVAVRPAAGDPLAGLHGSRFNMLRPFISFLADKTILQINDGETSFTRLLSQVCAHVVVLEADKITAKLTAASCIDLNNVSVVCDVLDMFEASDLFDVVVASGTNKPSSGKNNHFLPSLFSKAFALLKDDGVVLMPFANLAGLEYWSHSPTNSNNLQQAFGKHEVAAALQQAGFALYEFLYPFPDHAAANIILRENAFHDSVLNLPGLIMPVMAGSAYRPSRFPLPGSIRQLINNGLMNQLSPSVFVVASKKQVSILNEAILCYTYSAERDLPYCKENIFRRNDDNRISVSKQKLYPAQEAGAALVLRQTLQNELYTPGEIYLLSLIDLVCTKSWSADNIINWSRPYYELLMHYAGDDGLLPGHCADITPFNIIQKEDGGFHLFDQEWEVLENIPVHYVFFRGLLHSISRIQCFHAPQQGEPFFAFELVRKVVGHFFPDSAFVQQDFIEREKKYFAVVSPTGMPQQDFRLNIAMHDAAGTFIEPHLPIPVLSTVTVKIFTAGAVGDFSEANVVSKTCTLSAEKNIYSLKIEHSGKAIEKIRIDPAEQSGILSLYSIRIRNDKNESVFYQSNVAEGLACTDIFVACDTDSAANYLVLLSDDPMIVIDLPATNSGGNGYLMVDLEMSVAASNHANTIAKALRQMLQLFQSTGESFTKDSTPADMKAILRYYIEASASKSLELEETYTNLLSDRDKLIHERDNMIAGVENEITHLQGIIKWYADSFENRSLAGVIKSRFYKKYKSAYEKVLDRLLNIDFIKNKYAAAWVLQHARQNGARSLVSAIKNASRQHGTRIFTSPRQIILEKLREHTARVNQPLPSSVDLPAAPTAEEMEKQIAAFSLLPLVSIILPTYNTKPALLKKAVQSVLDQAYRHWELCIADDGSTSNETKKMIQSFANDKRIKISLLEKNGGISAASNEAIKLATGEFVALLDHDDELTIDALFWIAKEINAYPDTEMIYTDECKVNEAGALSDYLFKPDWSPELLFNMMYTGHFSVYKKALLDDQVGYFRSEYDFAQDYDLALRATEHTNRIRHVKRVLYHWRMTEGSAAQGDKPYARRANLAALKDAIERRKIPADIIELPFANRVKIKPDPALMVSVIVPTDSRENLERTLEAIAGSTSYKNFEVVVVTNSGLISTMQNNDVSVTVRYAAYDKPYNFSDKCNAGARHAKGDVLIFLNDDVRPMQADWMENTIEPLLIPGVGGASPQLVYENETIQYAGMAAGVRNLSGTTFHCWPKDSLAYFGFPQLLRNVSILSGACLAVKKSIFNAVGGFDAIQTPSAHSDVDLSFKLLENGWRCVYTPFARLRHIGHLALGEHEKKVSKLKKDKADIFLLKRYAGFLEDDPYFTLPMRNNLYKDSPEPFRLYAPAKRAGNNSKGDFLLVSHDLSRSGAPIMLYKLCEILLAAGYFVVLYCSEDGPLRQQYQALGVIVITDALALQQHESFYRFARNFDCIVCNTVITWPVLAQMQDTVKTIWWLHEGAVVLPFLHNPAFVKTLKNARNIISVSDYAVSYIKKLNDRAARINIGAADVYNPFAKKQSPADKLIFCMVGSIENRKGHDIVWEALQKMNAVWLGQMELWIIGRVLDETFKDSLLKKNIPAGIIKFMKETDHEGCLTLMQNTDVVINASRDDPFPLTLVEAFSMAKPCIISSHAGTAGLITHGKNGFVFENENPADLAQAIITVIKQRDELAAIGLAARVTYLQHMTIDKFGKQMLEYIEHAASPAQGAVIRKLPVAGSV